MILLHAAPIVWSDIGGLGTSIPALVAAQNRQVDVDAALAITSRRPGQSPAVSFPLFGGKIEIDRNHRLNLPAPFDRPDLVVFHSTYLATQARLAARLHAVAIPYLICPRGGMTRFAQRFRWWKKRAANLLFFNRMVRRAAAIHCLTRGEAEASDRWPRPRFIVGNGVSIPPSNALATPGKKRGRRFLFIGRLHIEYKGLDMLIDACHAAALPLRRAGAVVAIYGPDCNGSTQKLASQIARLGIDDIVTLHGPVLGDEKAALLRDADVFLHPSRSEGHPMAVLEALAHGLPCLITPVTNMADEVVAANAGWSVTPTPNAIAVGLRQIAAVAPDTLQVCGTAARRMAVARYNWDEIAACSIAAYREYATANHTARRATAV